MTHAASAGLAWFSAVRHASVSSVLSGSASLWSFGAGIVGPIFTGGRLTAACEAQQARWRQARAGYERTVLDALSDVSSALIARFKLGLIRVAREQAVRELRSSVELSRDRYLLGLADYFEVLQAEENLYASLQLLVQTQVDQLNNIVQLYRALGGGWHEKGP